MKELEKDQIIMSIRKEGLCLGWVESQDGKLIFDGNGYAIPSGEFDSLADMFRHLQGYDLKVDDFFY